MKMRTVAAIVALVSAMPAVAQDAAVITVPPAAPAAVPVQAALPAEAPRHVLPANTEIVLSMNQEVTTKGDTWEEGDTFALSVVHDVKLGDYVVIPRGTRAMGRITWLTSKGAFGKSGKMDIELDHLDLSGRRIDIDGTYRQEGEGNTMATVGGVLLAGVFAGFITGKSGRIPQGRELTAHLASDLPVALPAGAILSTAAVTAVAPAAPVSVATPATATGEQTVSAE